MPAKLEAHPADERATKAGKPLLGGIVAYLMLEDARAAIAFYREIFGAEVLDEHADPSGKIMNAHLKINGSSLMLMDAFPEHGHPFEKPQGYTLHLQVGDVDAWWNRAIAAGCEVIMPLEVQFWGDRYGLVKDRFGVHWSMAQPA